MLRPFADPRVGGVTPRQAIFDVGDDPVRRLADWIEDLRYLLTVPAQSVFGQVGCLAGRTIAYRRDGLRAGRRGARAPDRVRRPAARRRRPRAHQRAAARGLADRLPVDRAGGDRRARRTGARSGASSCAGVARASARRCSACAGCGAGRSRARPSRPTSSPRSRSTRSSRSASRTRSAPGDGRTGLPSRPSSASATPGCWPASASRQIPHLRRRPRDVLRLPLFVLQLTFLMVADPDPRLRDHAAPVLVDAPGRTAVRAAP